MGNCFHGGSFWAQIGPRLTDLDRAENTVNADVLDAWFPAAPAVIDAIGDRIGWLARTSPPTHAEGLTQELAERLGIDAESILPGPGSSSLIFHAFRSWLEPGSRVLLVEPTYGEYAHVADLAGCQIDRFFLPPEQGFRFDLKAWAERLRLGDYALAVIVNPNNPTGNAIGREELLAAIDHVPLTTRIWIDEAYLDYTAEQSLSTDAARSRNLYVVKSLSKSLALSGLRVAYLVGPGREVESLRNWIPPWSVSLPAQLAAIIGLRNPEYYAGKYLETAALRSGFAADLCELGLSVTEGAANWVLGLLPEGYLDAGKVVEGCARRSVYLRDAGRTAPSLGNRYVRIAVKPVDQQRRILDALAGVVTPELKMMWSKEKVGA